MNVPMTAMVGATAYGVRGKTGKDIPDGQYTRIVYTLLKERSYTEAIAILETELQKNPISRAALSLSAYAYYHKEDFAQAAEYYDLLVKNYPDVEQYKLYHAQSLYRAGQLAEAYKASLAVDQSSIEAEKVLKLQAAIKFSEGDLATTRGLVEQGNPESGDTVVNKACLLFAEGRFDEAEKVFVQGMNLLGYTPEIAYYIALCQYRQRRYTEAYAAIQEIENKGVQNFPELSISSVNQGLDVRSVGNSTALHESALIQAFNLHAAIDYVRGDIEVARDVLKYMPPRTEDELDTITLHNMALVNMDKDAANGFVKFQFLMNHAARPVETFANLLLLYCRYSFHDLAAALLAAHPELTFTALTPELYQYIEATILQQTAPSEAFQKFDELAVRHVENLRRLIKNLQEALNRENDFLTSALLAYNEALIAYLPVLMAQARIYWDRKNYKMCEKTLFQSVEFFYLDLEDNPRIVKILSQMGNNAFESEVWKLNLAHVFFMQSTKFVEAIQYYEPIVRRYEDNLLDHVAAMVLANICVAYIMNSQNDDAQALMSRVDQQETASDKHHYHSCIINLVIGTLYCAKGHYQFGISRIMHGFEHMETKLNTLTWFHAKRCFVALLEAVAKRTVSLDDATFKQMIEFLEKAELLGKTIKSVDTVVVEEGGDIDQRTVAHEARHIKAVLMRIRDF